MKCTSPARRTTRLATSVLVMLLPFAMFAWMEPFVDSTWTIGNDYRVYSIQNQLELQFALQQGEFPLFVRGYAAGSPSPTLCLGQLFHPLPHLAALAPGYWAGRALEWNTFLRLLSLGLCHLAVLALLRRFGVADAVAFGLSFATVYNLRMLDLFRYGASLEAYTGMLLLCTALVWHCLSPTRCLGFVSITVTTYLVAVSGHPQMAYYALLTALLVLMAAPALVRDLAPSARPAPRPAGRYYISALAAMGLGILGAAAFALPFAMEFLAENYGRVGRSPSWSAMLEDRVSGILANFYRPLASDVHGAFGGSFLPIAALSTLVFSTRSRTVPRIVWAALAVVVVVLLYCAGPATPVHELLWRILPLQSSMRVPGRASMILPVALLWIGVWAFGARPIDAAQRTRTTWALIFTFGVVLSLNLLFEPEAIRRFAPLRLRDVSHWMESITTAAGLLSLVGLFAVVRSDRRQPWAVILFCGALLLQTGLVLAHGTWRATKKPTPSLQQMRAAKRNGLAYFGPFGAMMYPASVVHHLEHTFWEPQLARLYASWWIADSNVEAYDWLSRDRRPDVAVVERPPEVPVAAVTANLDPADRVQLQHATGNRLVFTVRARAPRLFVLAFPFSGRWAATVGERTTEVLRVNGAHNGVLIPAGETRIEFRYRSPATLTGVAISLSTTAVLLWIATSGLTSWRMRAAARLAMILVIVGAWVDFNRSLYGGNDYGTSYEWTPPKRDPRHNLAFGKPTDRSRPKAFAGRGHLNHESNGVDGSAERPFAVKAADRPWWQVDLGRELPIKEVVLRGVRVGRTAEHLEVLLLGGGSEPAMHGRYAIKTGRNAVRLVLPEAIPARVVRLEAPRGQPMLIGEVEVFGP